MIILRGEYICIAVFVRLIAVHPVARIALPTTNEFMDLPTGFGNFI